MSSNLKVNNILPSTGDTVAISGIASVTSSVSIASSCTATTFYGSGANLTGITQTTINNNADNRVITGSGTANTLNAESGLTYNGSSILQISGSDQQQFTIGSTNSGGAAIALDGDSNGDASGGDYSLIRHNTDGDLEFYARNTGGATSTIFKQGTSEKFRINSNGDVTTTGASSFVRSNAGFTARAGDSVNITRASGTPLEITRTGNDGQMINFFKDTTGVAQIRWDGSFLTLGTWSDTDVLKVGSTVDVTKKLKVDYTVSGSDYVALFRNSNANSYGVQIKEPATVNNGYPLLSIGDNSGAAHFRVDSGTGQIYANSGAGTAKKAYFVRAWVNFDGQGGSAGQNRSIQESENVTSVYDNDQGDFTINFTTDMPHSAYVVCGMGANWENNNSDSYIITSAYKNSTSLGSCRVRTLRARFDQQPPQFRDSNENMIAIIC